jgi:hypothetical protein
MSQAIKTDDSAAVALHGIAKMTPGQVITEMTAIVEQPGYQFLQAYKNDFYVHDKAQLTENFSLGTRFLWVVNPNGTHLSRLGVHSKSNEWAIATMECGQKSSELGCEIYLISSAGVKKLTELQARTEIARKQYVVEYDHNTVTDEDGNLVAVFSVQTYNESGDGNIYANVVFQSPRLQGLSRADLTALREIGFGEATVVCQSFFVHVKKMELNGKSLGELICQTAAG